MGALGGFGKTVYAFHRWAKPVLTNGQLQRPTETLNNGQPWKARMSIQPVTGFQAMLLPEEIRNREPLKVFSEIPLLTFDDKIGQLGDRLTWSGRLFEIWGVRNWSGMGALSHYQYLALRVNPS